MKYLFFALLTTQSLYALDVSCDPTSTEHLPTVQNEPEELINALVNREFDPCAQDIQPARSVEQLCQRSPRDFQAQLCKKEGRMGFANNKGLFGLPTGVCWWHSQFHRNATYLAAFNPDKPKLDPSNREERRELRRIIRKIANRREMVEIPGYSSLHEFTSDPEIERLVQRRLQNWMAQDSFLKMQWVNGMTIPNTYTSRSPEYYTQQMGWILDPFKDHENERINRRAQRKFERKTYNSEETQERRRERTLEHQSGEVEDLFSSVNDRDEVGYITLQYPGVMAHAQIVFDAEKRTNEDGTVEYHFKVQDSNYQSDTYAGPNSWEKNAYSRIKYKDGVWYMKAYGNGLGNLSEGDYEPINIAVHKEKQFNRIDRVYTEQCGSPLFPVSDEEEDTE